MIGADVTMEDLEVLQAREASGDGDKGIGRRPERVDKEEKRGAGIGIAQQRFSITCPLKHTTWLCMVRVSERASDFEEGSIITCM